MGASTAEDYVLQEIEDQVDLDDAGAAVRELERLRGPGLRLGAGADR